MSLTPAKCDYCGKTILVSDNKGKKELTYCSRKQCKKEHPR